jgi:MSHA pilin protein MshD
MLPKPLAQQIGFTLIELIMSMVIISIALVGIFSVINITTLHSADPIVQHQAIAIAESYMDEILQQSYSGTASSVRADFNNVDNYNGLVNIGVQDQQGVAIAGLSQYTVTVGVSAPSTLSGGVNVKQITVSVSGPGVSGLTLVSYRANY